MNDIAIKIDYDAHFSDYTIEDIKGIEEFKKSLSEEYITYIKARGVGRGPAYDFVIEIIMNISLKEFIKSMMEGMAYDLIVYGTKKLILKPLFKALEKLDKDNGNSLRIGTFRLKFEESDIVITSINIGGVFRNLPKIFTALLGNYEYLKHPESEIIADEVRIPVIYDEKLDKSGIYKYRELREMEDLELNLDDSNYFNYWGLCFYINQQNLTYSVKDRKITSDDFCSALVYDTYLAKNSE